MVGFFDTLRIELAGSGINVTSIYPEWVATGISARALGPDGKLVGDVVAQEKGAMSPEECARLILKTAAERRREAMSPRLKFVLSFAPIFPDLIDQIAAPFFAGKD